MILSTQPLISVVVGSGLSVGSPEEHLVLMAGHAQILVV